LLMTAEEFHPFTASLACTDLGAFCAARWQACPKEADRADAVVVLDRSRECDQAAVS